MQVLNRLMRLVSFEHLVKLDPKSFKAHLLA